MKFSVSDYLYQKASLNKIPLSGCLELSPVCNFTCKMCYVRKTYKQIQNEGKYLKHWSEWLKLAKQLKEAGTLYLLITGGEPFIYPNFKELYLALHEMAFVISINSNGTMIDENTVKWLKKAAPSRINITLYGASRETYKKICNNPDGYDKAVKAILMLKEAGIPVVINASMIPENKHDMNKIIEFGKKHGINTRISTYMFPPVRREKEDTDSRFDSTEAALMYINKNQCQMDLDIYKKFLKNQLSTLDNNKSNNMYHKQESNKIENWGVHKEEYMRCRAGRSSFWVSWDGTMTACGMLKFPIAVYPFDRPFKECWMDLTNKVRTTTVLKECIGCNKKEICNPCVAMLNSEVGNINKKAPYLCEMTDIIVLEMKKRLSELEGESIEK